jgi:hypothetical protein
MNELKYLLLLSLLFPLCAAAQEEDEYKMEIGGGIGLIAYEGDFNGSITKGMQPGGSLIARWNLNPHMAIKADLTIGKIKGSSDNSTTYYPNTTESPIKFSKGIYDLTGRYEYNFWGYGAGKVYRGVKQLTPYMSLGAGITYVNGDNNNAMTINFPIGIGVKYKAANRLNVGAEWTMHFSMSDKLDGVKDPYGIKSTGMFKNTDCYSILQVFVTYDIMPKCVTCHNADERY